MFDKCLILTLIAPLTGMFEMWPRMKRCTVVAKRPLMFAGAFGFGAWLSGLVFIDRLKTDKARRLMKQATDRVIREKVRNKMFSSKIIDNARKKLPSQLKSTCVYI